MPDKIRVAIIGAGGRGLNAHGQYIADHPAQAEVVAVADPKSDRRELAKTMFPSLKDEMVFDNWQDLLALGKIADAVIIATMENIHEPIATACAKLGYHMLLEKPMAPTAQACRNIVAAAKEAGVIFAVSHELRYASMFRRMRQIIESGAIGDIVHIQHVEDISYWHFTHSFVRGHNNNSDRTSFSLLSKSCHDIDIIRFLMGQPCLQVHSFGGLKHFRREEKPAQAGDATRCLECPYEPKCPYSAMKIYIDKGVNIGADAMPGESISRKLDRDELMTALRVGKFGLCVYECDNNVADHQVVNLLYAGGRTASFTMAGFTEGGRATSVQGTRGLLRARLHAAEIRRYDFRSDEWIDESVRDERALDGHGGGDAHLMAEWLEAIETGDPTKIITGPDETLETHLTTFAAEQSRHDGDVKTLI
jgi:predicted dehydrogenase